MSTYIHREILLFFQFACIGAVLLLCSDILVIFRKLFSHSAGTCGVWDLLYWIGVGFFLFARVYGSNEGSWRFFLLLGILAGFLLCRRTVSPIFVMGMEKFLGIPLFFVKKVIKRLLFWGKRCKLFLSRFARVLFLRKKKKVQACKRAEQIEKSKKNKKKKI